MYLPKSQHVKLALKTIEVVAKKLDISALKLAKIPDELQAQLACFVSIHLLDGNLRGCIGTIEPREKNLYNEIISNATSAAIRDTRFLPVLADELDNLEVSVDVLSKPVLIDDLKLLNPKKYGVIVTDGSYARGVLLPDIEGVETIDKQLNIARRKAGLTAYDFKDLKIYSFTSTRFH